MKATQTQKPLAGMRLNDSGKLLLVLDTAAQRPVLEVRKNRLDSYLYLLNRETILPVGYAFTFEPLPFSSQLWSDITVFRQLEFVASASPSLVITSTGRDWLHERLSAAEDREEVVARIRGRLDTYVNWDTGVLFHYIYYQATAS